MPLVTSREAQKGSGDLSPAGVWGRSPQGFDLIAYHLNFLKLAPMGQVPRPPFAIRADYL